MNIINSPIGPIFQYDNIEELTYNFLICIGLSVMPNGVVIDTELSEYPTTIKIGGKTIKANISPDNIHYAGEGEIMLDILSNYKMLNNLFGLFLDKKKLFDNIEVLSFFPEECTDNNGRRMSKTTIKFITNNHISSEYYYNRCLSLIDLVFRLSEENVNIHNFDTIEDRR